MQRLNLYDLANSIDRLCLFLDDEYNVNNGGCCFVAYLLAKHLDILGIKYDLVIYDYLHKDIKNIRHEIVNKHINYDCSDSITGCNCCNHYCLRIKKCREINNCECCGGSRYVIKNIKHDSIEWIYDNGDWNECYDISNNQTIANIVKSFFEPYEEVSGNKDV